MENASLRYCWGPAWEEYYFQFWSKAEIVNRIRRMEKEGNLIHFAAIAGEGEWRLIRAATHYFGSWRAAVKAAGYNYQKVRADIKWTRKNVVQAIRRLRRQKDDLSSRAVQLKHPALFAAAVRERLFGSWGGAIRAAGMNYDRIRKYEKWDVKEIRKEIKRLAKAKVALNAKNVCDNHSRVYYAACKRYGSWGKTLKALKFNSKSIAIRRKRSKGEIVSELKALRRKGVHMSDNNVRSKYPTLYAAACKAYGSWTKARQRAGIPSVRGKKSRRAS